MKIGNIIQRIQSLYSKGVESDDSRLTSRHIYNKILTVRAKLISQELNKKNKFSGWDRQLLKCVELEEVPAYNCPCILPPTCKTVLRSKYKIPEPLGGKIFSITSVDRGIKIDIVEKNAVKSLSGNKYSGKKIGAFIEDSYLYIINDTSIKIVAVEAVFQDPIEVEEFNKKCDCSDCVSCDNILDVEFNIDLDKIDTLVELSVKELVDYFKTNREDLSNDSKDSLIQESK